MSKVLEYRTFGAKSVVDVFTMFGMWLRLDALDGRPDPAPRAVPMPTVQPSPNPSGSEVDDPGHDGAADETWRSGERSRGGHRFPHGVAGQAHDDQDEGAFQEPARYPERSERFGRLTDGRD